MQDMQLICKIVEINGQFVQYYTLYDVLYLFMNLFYSLLLIKKETKDEKETL